MNPLTRLFFLTIAAASPVIADSSYLAQSTSSKIVEVGSRGWYTTQPPFAAFDADHPSVEIWVPKGDSAAPIIVYAHGGAGFREDDEARVEMMRRNGFATISFDAYVMNGLDDWQFVSRRVTNAGKQNLIWGVFKGAVDYALQSDDWDNRGVFFYGGSNGGRVVLYAGSQMSDDRVRGIISEAPAATGFELGDYSIPTIVSFGALDTWAGKSKTDFVWTRTFPSSPVSIKDWVDSRRAAGRPVELMLYENAGHLLFDGPLEEVTIRRGNEIAFTAYKGAGEGVLDKYEHDIVDFVSRNGSP
ncbi:MAG: hypothetical protein QNJ05_05495 [Woeseiaceae bacterium]|nr:hypothetical protein [Woeseiaceae bacterium]